MQRLRSLLLGGNIFLVAVTFLVYFTSYVNPQGKWPLAVLGLFYPALLACNVLFIVLWGVWRRWYFVLSAGCLLLGWGHVRTMIGLSAGRSANWPAENTLRVMTFNCRSFAHSASGAPLISQEKLTDLLRTHHPDILCFQEFADSRNEAKVFSEWVKTSYDFPYQGIRISPSLAIFSRYPLEGEKAFRFENSFNGYQITDVEVNGRKFRLFNLHLQTNAISGLADKVTSSGDLKSKETWRDMEGMLRRYQRAARRRVDQARQVLDQAEASPYPVLLCGDLNDVPQSYVYRTLQQGRVDAFRRAGQGLGVTYAGKIPGLRIDYIFVPHDLPVLQTKILRPGFSDHRPVIATILVEKAATEN